MSKAESKLKIPRNLRRTSPSSTRRPLASLHIFNLQLSTGAQSNPMVTYLIAIPYTTLSFVMFGLATYFCIPLGVAVCGVILSRDIHPRTKAVVAVVGAISYISLVRWAKTTKLF